MWLYLALFQQNRIKSAAIRILSELSGMYPGAIGLNLPPNSPRSEMEAARAENRTLEHLPPTVTSVNHTGPGGCTQIIFYY